MSKLSTILAAALIAAAGSASATTMLLDGSTTYTVTSAADKVTSFTLPAKQTAGVILDFDFSFTGTLQNNDYFALWFGNSTGPSFGLKANCGGDVSGCTNDLYLRMGGASGNFLANSNLTAGTNYHLKAYLYKAGNTGLSSLTTVGFRTVNIDNGVVLTASDINASAVPEPGTLSLMGLAIAGLGFLRRRKSA